jgi:VanZ family protein
MIDWLLSIRARRAVCLILAAYWIALVYGTHRAGLPSMPTNFDKVLHFSAYAGLAFLLSISVFWSRKVRWWHFVTVFIAVAAFGATDELTQPPFGRTADWYDWYSDLGGAFVGVLLGAGANSWLRRAAAQKASQENQ